MPYEIIVGNIGSVLGPCSDLRRAKRQFKSWVRASKAGCGKAGNEPVTLMFNGTIVAEHDPVEELVRVLIDRLRCVPVIHINDSVVLHGCSIGEAELIFSGHTADGKDYHFYSDDADKIVLEDTHYKLVDFFSREICYVKLFRLVNYLTRKPKRVFGDPRKRRSDFGSHR